MALQSWTIEEIKPGHIRMYNGLLASIPVGWVLCDGSNGTPDLRGRYPKGAAASIEAGDTGGALTHSHAVHDTVANLRTGGAAFGFSSAGEAGHDTPNHEPPFRSVHWIMKS